MENIENKPLLKRFLHSFLKLLILILLLVVFFWIGGEKIIENKIRQYFHSQSQLAKVSLPAPDGPRAITYTWKFNGKQYSIEENLYSSYYNFYTSLPKTYSYYEGELSQNWEEEYFNMFLNHPAEDKTIPELANRLKELGIKNNLKDDQIIELVLSFVQNITYDETKAKKILSEGSIDQSNDTSVAPNYPYEVLYEKTGVCSDKSILAYSLIKELGYGTALFVYDKENHMSVGIKCPQDYSSYNSGYCYAETTNPGNKIGIIPELDTTNNQASSAKEIDFFGNNESSSSDSKIIGKAKIINTTDGKIYTGIVQTIADQQSIADLKIFLNKEKTALSSIKTSLSENQNEITSLKNKMDKLLAKDDYAGYNDLVPKYNGLVTSYQKNLKTYNNRIDTYNKKVNEYNSLIKSFYQI